MLTASRAAAVTGVLDDAFAAIGVRMPVRSQRQEDPVAWEYHAGCHLARQADSRKKLAIKHAIAAGVIFDHEKHPREPGIEDLAVYASDLMLVRLTVGTPKQQLDTVGLLSEIAAKYDIPPATLARLVAKHAGEQRAPHSFKSALVTA